MFGDLSDEIHGTEIAYEQFSERRNVWRKATVLVSTRRKQSIDRKIAAIQDRHGDNVRNFTTKDTKYFHMSLG